MTRCVLLLCCRLSDFLFTVARVAAAADGVDEEVYVRPQPEKSTDGHN